MGSGKKEDLGGEGRRGEGSRTEKGKKERYSWGVCVYVMKVAGHDQCIE